MRNLIIVLSGPIAAGKSTLAEALAKSLGLHHLRTRQALLEMAKAMGDSVTLDRVGLQDYGDSLDQKTHHGWLANKVAQATMREPRGVVVDSVRKVDQVEAIRRFPEFRVVHIHVEAALQTVLDRHRKRDNAPHPGATHTNEQSALACVHDADYVLDNTFLTVDDEVVLVKGFLGLTMASLGSVDALVGGQYGSEGKGHIVSYIAQDYGMMVRVGGPNAGHTVLHPYTGEKVSFYHLPSGALHMNGPLVLGPGANINLSVLKKELEVDGLDPGRVFIDPQANLITPDDITREMGLVGGIGSTGQGVGAATSDRIMGRSNNRQAYLVGANRDKVESLGVRVVESSKLLEGALAAGERVLLEGTQGTGLSLYHGAYPYVTSRDTTVGGTAAEAGIAPSLIRKVFMVCRTNPIRVQSPADGTSGPMSQETTWEVISKRAGLPPEVLRQKEMTTTTKRQRRVSEFDWPLLLRSAQLNRPTDIALTFCDYIGAGNQHARRYEDLTEETHRLVENIERVTRARVSLLTTRFHKRSIIDRRFT